MRLTPSRPLSHLAIADTCFKERGLDRIRHSRPLYWLQGLTAGKRYKNRGLDHESVGRQVNQLPNTKKGRVISSALLVYSGHISHSPQSSI
jgi:hypothetical protein